MMATHSLKLLVLISFLHSIQTIAHTQPLLDDNIYYQDTDRIHPHHHRKLHFTQGTSYACSMSDAYDIALVLDDTGGLTHLQCYIQKLAVSNILKMLKNKHQNPRVTLIQVHGDDCEVLVPLNSGLNDNIQHYVRYVRSVMSCDDGTGVTALDCGLLRAVDEFARIGRDTAHKRIIAINNCQTDDMHDAQCDALSAEIDDDDIDVVFINAMGAHCEDVDGQNGTNVIVDPSQYGACVADEICVADTLQPRHFMHAVRECQHAICKEHTSTITTTETPTTNPTTIPTQIPTVIPTTETPTALLGADFILLYDNSCGTATHDCPALLEGMGEIIASLLHFPNSRVQTMSFGGGGGADDDGVATQTIVGFEDADLQNNIAGYINAVEQRNVCGDGGKGRSDLAQALYDVLSVFDDDDVSVHRLHKLVIVSACIDEDEDEICGVLTPQLRTDGVDVYAVNLIASSSATNVIDDAEMAASYLLCAVDNDPYRICVGEQPSSLPSKPKAGVRIEQFHRIIEQCLWPEICARFTYDDDRSSSESDEHALGKPDKPSTTPWTTTTTTTWTTSTTPWTTTTTEYDDDDESWPTPTPTRKPTRRPTRIPKTTTWTSTSTSTTPWTTTTTEYDDWTTRKPTAQPTSVPTAMPTSLPTRVPTKLPTPITTTSTSTTPWTTTTTEYDWTTHEPTALPTLLPTKVPTPRTTAWTTSTSTTPWTTTTTDYDDKEWPTPQPTARPTRLPTPKTTTWTTSTTPWTTTTTTDFDSDDGQWPTLKPTTPAPTKLPTPRTTAWTTSTSTTPWTTTTTTDDDNGQWPTRKPTKHTRRPTTNAPTLAPTTTTTYFTTTTTTTTDFTTTDTEMPTTKPTTLSPTPVPSTTTTTVTTTPPTVMPTVSPSTTTTDFTTTTTTTEFTTTITTDFTTTYDPTTDPTHVPTHVPTEDPTADPTVDPTEDPTLDPTREPTSANPTEDPTEDPTAGPTVDPTQDPTREPSQPTTAEPSAAPTPEPTPKPTRSPTEFHPTTEAPATGMPFEVDDEALPFTGPDVPILPVNTDTSTNDNMCPHLSSSSSPSTSQSWNGKFVLFIDNSCKLSNDRCNIVLQSAGRLVTQLLKIPNAAVATFDFGQDRHDVRLLVDFDDLPLQRSATDYAAFLETDGQCSDNGRGATDLWSALQHGIFMMSHLSFEGNPKFIILSSCMDEDADMCSTAKQQLDRLNVDVFVVNMLQVDDVDKRIENAIQSQSDALLYLSCLTSDNQVCVADADDSAEVSALETVFNECLTPQICASIETELDAAVTNLVADDDLDTADGQDFVVFLDNSCGASHMVCSHYLYGIQQIIASLLQRSDTRVAAIQFGAYQHHTKVLVDFSDTELQSDFGRYRKVLSSSAQCTKGGSGETDLLYALELSEEILDDNRNTKFVIVSMCQEASDNICAARSELLQARQIEIYAVNLLSASSTKCADNAILTTDDAQTYLSCLMNDDGHNEICVGEVRSERDMWAFPDILNDCLVPQMFDH